MLHVYGEKVLKHRKRRVLLRSRCRLHGYMLFLQLFNTGGRCFAEGGGVLLWGNECSQDSSEEELVTAKASVQIMELCGWDGPSLLSCLKHGVKALCLLTCQSLGVSCLPLGVCDFA